MLNPDMPTTELLLHMGEMTAQEVRTARAAIRWANTQLADAVKVEGRISALSLRNVYAGRTFVISQDKSGTYPITVMLFPPKEIPKCEKIPTST